MPERSSKSHKHKDDNKSKTGKPDPKIKAEEIEAKNKLIAKKNQDREKEDKELKFRHLQDEIELLRSQLKPTSINDQALPTSKLKAEIQNLEVKIIQQTSQLARLEDKYHMLQKAHTNAIETLAQSHTEVMDKEELSFIVESIENKQNELLLARNFVSEMQKVGYSNLPPKVVDECKKTHMELDYIIKTTKQYKEQTDEIIEELKANSLVLTEVKGLYHEKKVINHQLEVDIDEIVVEIDALRKLIHTKEREAEDLDKVVTEIGDEINKVMEDQELSKQYQREREEVRQEKLKRNKDLDDIKKKYSKLQKAFGKKEKQLRNKIELSKKMKDEAMDAKKYNINDLRAEYEVILNEIVNLKVNIIEEKKLKMEYFNILEDMLGKMKTICRCRDGTKDNVLEISEETNIITLKSNKFAFDHYYGPTMVNENIFESVHYLYQMANDGFNCYIVTMGGKQSGKSHITIGEKEDGLVFLGLNKLRDIIKINKKSEMKTRMFVCSVEMSEDIIFDLITGQRNDEITIKKDCFKMTLLAHASYKECFADDEVRKYLKIALKNRSLAAKSLKSSHSTFVFLVTMQRYNKFQHRYWKGKITHVKLGSLRTMESLNTELKKLARGGEIDYKTNNITLFLQDCFGGASKTCVIGCVDPSSSCVDEAKDTMNLVSNLKNVTNEIGLNSESEKIFSLKNDIERLLRGVKQESL